MKKKISIIVILAIAVIAVAFGSIGYQQHVEAANRAAVQKKENKMKKQVEALYLDPTEKKLAKQLTQAKITKAEHALSSLSDKSLKKRLKVKVDAAQHMYDAAKAVGHVIDAKQVVKDNVTAKQLQQALTKIKQVDASKQTFVKELQTRYQAANKQWKQIKQLKKGIAAASTQNSNAYDRYAASVKKVKNKTAKAALTKSLKQLKAKINRNQAAQKEKQQQKAQEKAQQAQKEKQATTQSTDQTATPNTNSNNKQATNGGSSSNAGSEAKNGNRSTPKGGSSSTAPKTSNKQSSGKNNSYNNRVNDVLDSINNGKEEYKGSTDGGDGRTWDHYEIKK
ncbi:hypothetical protein AWK91_15205 [Listeria monocytogenes]|uniref:hypothetical protein n=1 Tax=Listeria monocytogenes TaxID=1639 RepID=UPI000BE090CD|nr:hypothetical protein [Listeria monocytogenes]EAE2723028.1 hypothetical protein [Listeria monocytogenes]EAE2738788.1 hypothetical protein [Listeria monocytogenes]PDD93477.1 hypothetical protein AWK44_07870 [Listeria monocytogenes]PDE43907.1 hypothetical protein AWK82_11565 [Listeria monocytogenes]PDE64381.1 hypothetical protein AWK91_15205 [Listeria monocytogenes]